PRLEQAPRSWTITTGLEVLATNAVVATAVVAPSLFIELESEVPRLLSPVLRIVGRRSLETVFERSDGRASFVWTVGGAEACVLRGRLPGGFAFWPCAMVDLGILQARGEEVADGRVVSTTWVDAGFLGRGRWTHGRITIGLDGGLVHPFRSERFRFDTG